MKGARVLCGRRWSKHRATWLLGPWGQEPGSAPHQTRWRLFLRAFLEQPVLWGQSAGAHLPRGWLRGGQPWRWTMP